MRRLLAIVLVMMGTAASASAQDSGALGVTMGYPASIGVIWHVSDRVAIRPEISLTQISSTSSSVITTIGPGGVVLSSTTTQASTDQWTVGYGASALFYVKQWDALRTYVSPRFVYTRASVAGTSSSSTAAEPASTTEFDSNAYLVTGSFGAEYAFGTRFALYGEVGFGYSRTTTDSTQAGASNTTANSVGTRSGVGVILYFPR